MNKKDKKENSDSGDKKDIKSNQKRKMSLAVPDLKGIQGLTKKERQEHKRSTLGIKDGSSLEATARESVEKIQETLDEHSISTDGIDDTQQSQMLIK